jgi:hypothetical protein
MKMRYVLMVVWLFWCAAASASVQVSVGIAMPGLSIGINQPSYPDLVLVPGYPVYYAPNLSQNYFFYDGVYWVYQRDNWYASDWYNGPWDAVSPDDVPLFILRVPVYYYRQPPVYFQGWRQDAPPRWGRYWGEDWSRRRHGWNHWDRRATFAPAPLPTYQRQYSGDRYPRGEQQQRLNQEHYRYQPRDAASGIVMRQRGQQQGQQRQDGSPDRWHSPPQPGQPQGQQQPGHSVMGQQPSGSWSQGQQAGQRPTPPVSPSSSSPSWPSHQNQNQNQGAQTPGQRWSPQPQPLSQPQTPQWSQQRPPPPQPSGQQPQQWQQQERGQHQREQQMQQQVQQQEMQQQRAQQQERQNAAQFGQRARDQEGQRPVMQNPSAQNPGTRSAPQESKPAQRQSGEKRQNDNGDDHGNRGDDRGR